MSDLKDPRVFFAAERTLLAWNRTSIALIAFGFVIERSGLLIALTTPAVPKEGQSLATLWVGLMFILLGAWVAIFASRQYACLIKSLDPVEIPQGYSARWGIWINGVVALLGVLLAVALWAAR